MAANITLRLNEALLKRVRHLAVDRNLSVSAWVGELVARAVEEQDGFEQARKTALSFLAEPAQIRGQPLDREQAHER